MISAFFIPTPIPPARNRTNENETHPRDSPERLEKVGARMVIATFALHRLDNQRGNLLALLGLRLDRLFDVGDRTRFGFGVLGREFVERVLDRGP
jgi:hypothetical protein